MKSSDSVSLIAVILLTITSVGLFNHVTVIPVLIEAVGRDAWVSVLLAGFVTLCWIPLLYFVMRKSKQKNVFVWLQEKVGKVIAFLLIGSISLLFLIKSTVTITELTEWTIITYLPGTPNLLIIGIFSIICFLTAITNLRTIAIVNGVLLPIVVTLGFFVMFANQPNKDYSLLFPVLEKGFDASLLKGMVFSAAGLVEIIVILLIQHKINSSIKLIPLLITTVILMGLTIGPLIGAIVEFGPVEAARQRFPAYEEWALVSIGRYVEHVDFLSIYQWLTGAFIRISFFMFLIPEIFNLTDQKKRVKVLGGYFITMIILTQLPNNDFQFHYILSTYFLPVTLFFIVAVSLLFSLLVLIKRKKGGSRTHEIS
ncbi:endospore germination permease [Alkalihalophilus sp. As8PL]|uniref:Endospore germination permease n=1 Tax=Alkalihalophilus sp. As8PL TaxID=3237103 RepID=A0AB39BW76_9BACI